MEKQLRKYQSSLLISSLAVIAFGLWSIIKTVILFTNNMYGSGQIDEEILSSTFLYTVFIVITLVLFLIDLALRLVVGLNGRAESKGKKKGWGYLVVTIFLAVLSLTGFLSTIQSIFSSSLSDVVDIIASAIVEGTALIALIDVIVSSIQIKKITRILAQTSGE